MELLFSIKKSQAFSTMTSELQLPRFACIDVYMLYSTNINLYTYIFARPHANHVHACSMMMTRVWYTCICSTNNSYGGSCVRKYFSLSTCSTNRVKFIHYNIQLICVSIAIPKKRARNKTLQLIDIIVVVFYAANCAHFG